MMVALADSRPLEPPTRRVTAALVAVVLLVLASALLALAALPTGSADASDALAPGRRVATDAAVDDARVLLAVAPGGFEVAVAYPGPKGWLAVTLADAPRSTVAAWAGTAGAGDVPAVAAVYGNVLEAAGGQVEVRWVDGERTSAAVNADGTYLSVRTERVDAAAVTIADGRGRIVRQVRL